jgi:hypothetical protein
MLPAISDSENNEYARTIFQNIYIYIIYYKFYFKKIILERKISSSGGMVKAHRCKHLLSFEDIFKGESVLKAA